MVGMRTSLAQGLGVVVVLLFCCFSLVHAQTATVFISPTGSDTLNTGKTATSPFNTLQRAKSAQTLSTPNLIINCANGVYPAGPTVLFSITGNVTLQATTAPASGTFPVIFNQTATPAPLLSMSSTTSVLTLGAGLQIVGGSGSNGGLLLSMSPITATGVLFRDGSSTGVGGAVYISGAAQPSSFTDCQFLGNTAAGLGGAVSLANTDATFSGCRFLDNGAQAGGAVSVSNTEDRNFVVSFSDSVFQRNTATSGSGGALSVAQPGHQLLLTGCQFTDNPAAVSLGAGVLFTASGSSFQGSSPYAVQATSASLAVTECTFGQGNGDSLLLAGASGAVDSTTITGCSFANSSSALNLRGLQSPATLTGLQLSDPLIVDDTTFALTASTITAAGRLNLTLPNAAAPATITDCMFLNDAVTASLVTLTSVDPTAATLASLTINNGTFTLSSSLENAPPVLSVRNAGVSVSLSVFDVNDLPLLRAGGTGASSVESSYFLTYSSVDVVDSASVSFSYPGQFAQVDFTVSDSASLSYIGRNGSSFSSLSLYDSASASLALQAVVPNTQNLLNVDGLVLDGLVTLACLSNDTAYSVLRLEWHGGVVTGPGTTTTLQIPRVGVAFLLNELPKSLIWNTITNYGQLFFIHSDANASTSNAIDLVTSPAAITNYGLLSFGGDVAIAGGYCSIWNAGNMLFQPDNSSAPSTVFLGSATVLTMLNTAVMTYEGPWQSTAPFVLSQGEVSVAGTLRLNIVDPPSGTLAAWTAIQFSSSNCSKGPCRFERSQGNLVRSKGGDESFNPAITYSSTAITIVETDVKKPLGGGAIAGIVIGSIAGAILLAGAAYLVWTKYYVSHRHGDRDGLYNPINEPGSW